MCSRTNPFSPVHQVFYGAMQRHILNGRLVSKPQTHLKYAVEVQIPRDPLRLLGLVEPIIERMVYEDLPLNLVCSCLWQCSQIILHSV